MQREPRQPRARSRWPVMEMGLLTLLVVGVMLPIGLLIRGSGEAAPGGLTLMSLEQAHDIGVADARRATPPTLPATAGGLAAESALDGPLPPAISAMPDLTGSDSVTTDALTDAIADAATDATSAPSEETVYFNGRPLRKVRTMQMLVTAYSPDERSCGIWADGVTASGYSVWTNGMRLVAADTRLLPFGSIVTIPGYHGGQPVPVLDRGGAIKGNRLDVLYPTHERALRWGAQRLDVDVWAYADE